MSFVPQQVVQYILTGIMIGTIYAVVALSYNILYNATGAVNFAQGEFLMLGAMIAIGFYNIVKLPLILSIVLSTSVVMVIGIIFERLAIRRMKKPSILGIIICTLGAAIFIRGLTLNIAGPYAYPLPPYSGDKPIYIFGSSFLPQGLWILGITICIFIVMKLYFDYTMIGKAMKATAINRMAAQSLGIKVQRMVSYSFALSALIGAIAGVIIAPVSFMSYTNGTMLGLKGFAVAAFGGIGNNFGAIVAGLILGLLESFAAGFISSGYKDGIAFIMLIIVLIIRPRGIFFTRDIFQE